MKNEDADVQIGGSSGGDPSRGRWPNRLGFVLACIGSAVGLGNVWRFPSLVYEYGGGPFFIPYLLALFFVGIPLLILEFALGQVYQSGDIISFGSIHKRLRGIGFASVWEAFMVVVYYNVIIAWALYYFIASFQSPLPWMEFTATNLPDESTTPAKSYFFGNVLDLGAPEDGFLSFRGEVFGAVVFTWATIFFSIWKGVAVTGRIVYLTAILPGLMLITLLIVGNSLEGSQDGIQAYIGNWDMTQLSKGDMWSRAVTQIFFSIGVTFGIMTAYASYNDRHAKVVQDALIVSISNSVFSFIAGFAVYSILGYMALKQGVPVSEVSSGGVGLAFVVYPVGLGLVGGVGGNVLCAIFFLTLFLLGIDSAFSLVEASCTAVHDAKHFNNVSREMVAGVVCMIGCLLGTFYCTNIGLYLLDVIDYWINGIAMLFVGLMEVIAAGWCYALKQQYDKIGKTAVQAHAASWLVGILLVIFISHAGPYGGVHGTAVGIPVGVVFICLGIAASAFLSTNESKVKAAGDLLTLNIETLRADLNQVVTKNGGWAIPYVWGIVIKFVLPALLLVMLSLTFAERLETAYEGYNPGYQAIGLIVALSSTAMIVLGLVWPDAFENWMPPEEKARDALGHEDEDIKFKNKTGGKEAVPLKAIVNA